eukprot:5841527-Pleurochrysis_carterae.AAC.2
MQDAFSGVGEGLGCATVTPEQGGACAWSQSFGGLRLDVSCLFSRTALSSCLRASMTRARATAACKEASQRS